jgi:two-component system CheB/CheR fusion protein
MPIDLFLRSLAADQKNKAIGIILSGNASDGTLGVMAIKAQGGITFAQSGESAKYDGMPRNAAASGCIDFVLSPEQIGEELTRLGQHPYIARVEPQEDEPVTVRDGGDNIARILRILRKATGVDFSYYKPNTLRRRILRRMALLHVENLDVYITRLRADPQEAKTLYEEILITVTEFFRDPDVFEALNKVVFPKIVPTQEGAGSIRIWVPACSSGEEVYSIAIALLEFLGERSADMTVQIFGTDISETALAKARRGIYAASLVEGISKERLNRFFTKVDSNYVISQHIREMCIFAAQNVIKDPPFSKINLISCRNLLIYLSSELQNRLIPIFHYALKPSGFLLLGASETLRSSPLFSIEDRKHKIYVRLPAAAHVPLSTALEIRSAGKEDAPAAQQNWREAELAHEAERIILDEYPGAIVDDQFNIVQFRGKTGAYLEPESGEATLNLFKMARPGLVRELRAGLEKARREHQPVRCESLHVSRDDGLAVVNIEIMPFKKAAATGNHYLILFEEVLGSKPKPGQNTAKTRLSRAALEHELTMMKEYHRSIIEQHETADEELRAANEEIQSANEELQSTNEELESAKEELQSTNEELSTVNEELQSTNAQLARSGMDLLNLLNNINVPIVMVGNDLRIRRFTPVSQKLLNLIPSDIGRPISDINLNLDVPNFEKMLKDVIENLVPKILTLKNIAGRDYSLHIRPYRTEDNKIDGAVMLLVDLQSGLTTVA